MTAEYNHNEEEHRKDGKKWKRGKWRRARSMAGKKKRSE